MKKITRIITVVASLTLLLALGGYLVFRKLSRPPVVVGQEIYPPRPGGPAIDHRTLDALLRRFVADGMVDYGGLNHYQSMLPQYLEQIAGLDQRQYGRDELLALFINAYNATTLKLILEHFPGIHSIRDIPSPQRWQDRRWRIAGETLSIDEIENKVLRKRFREPRIHFAIVCASVGCPPLRAEAYRGSQIDFQLADQARIFNQSERYVKLQGNTLLLSSIYDWYSEDFKSAAGSVLGYVAGYSNSVVREAIQRRGSDLRIEYLPYDWRLNAADNAGPSEK
jgi:hypothetical protein